MRGGGPAADAARVLVVEDEAAMRTAIVRALRGSGWHTCARADGEDLEQTLHGLAGPVCPGCVGELSR